MTLYTLIEILINNNEVKFGYSRWMISSVNKKAVESLKSLMKTLQKVVNQKDLKEEVNRV